MSRSMLSRCCFALTALCVLVGLVIQVLVSSGLKNTQFGSPAALVFNVFCYFTVQFNIIAGVVFHLVLAGLQDLHGSAAVADQLLHTVAPTLSVLGWLVFGPRGLVSWRVARLAVLFPACWVVLALVRGALIDFYAYPFIDVRTLGYPRVLVNVALVGALFFALAAGSIALDRRLGRPARESPTAVS